jgi:hypothetical protein
VDSGGSPLGGHLVPGISCNLRILEGHVRFQFLTKIVSFNKHSRIRFTLNRMRASIPHQYSAIAHFTLLFRAESQSDRYKETPDLQLRFASSAGPRSRNTANPSNGMD